MDVGELTISEFRGVMRVFDKKGRYLEMKHRHCAVVIITLSGKIRFSCEADVFICDCDHPIFIGEGASYINECLEDAESLMFSFRVTAPFEQIETLMPLPLSEHLRYFEEIKNAGIEKRTGFRLRQLSLMYRMLEEMLRGKERFDSLSFRAAAGIREKYSNPSFTCRALASALFVSEAYLRRKFKKEYGIGIGEYLREVRMEKARELLLECRSVSETSTMCGYSDVYQFSRAYKQYYGHAPSLTCKV